MKNLDLKIRTNGKGLWSDKATTVNIIGYEITDISKEYNYAYIRLYFDNSWDVSKDGFIYTDTLFLMEAKRLLKPILNFGYIDYTEQGMQGINFVSLECSFSKKDIKELRLLKEII